MCASKLNQPMSGLKGINSIPEVFEVLPFELSEWCWLQLWPSQTHVKSHLIQVASRTFWWINDPFPAVMIYFHKPSPMLMPLDFMTDGQCNVRLNTTAVKSSVSSNHALVEQLSFFKCFCLDFKEQHYTKNPPRLCWVEMNKSHLSEFPPRLNCRTESTVSPASPLSAASPL